MLDVNSGYHKVVKVSPFFLSLMSLVFSNLPFLARAKTHYFGLEYIQLTSFLNKYIVVLILVGCFTPIELKSWLKSYANT